MHFFAFFCVLIRVRHEKIFSLYAPMPSFKKSWFSDPITDQIFDINSTHHFTWFFYKKKLFSKITSHTRQIQEGKENENKVCWNHGRKFFFSSGASVFVTWQIQEGKENKNKGCWNRGRKLFFSSGASVFAPSQAVQRLKSVLFFTFFIICIVSVLNSCN